MPAHSPDLIQHNSTNVNTFDFITLDASLISQLSNYFKYQMSFVRHLLDALLQNSQSSGFDRS